MRLIISMVISDAMLSLRSGDIATPSDGAHDSKQLISQGRVWS